MTDRNKSTQIASVNVNGLNILIKAQRIFRLKFHKNDLNIGCIHLKYNIESKRMEEKHFLNGKKGPQRSAPLKKKQE